MYKKAMSATGIGLSAYTRTAVKPTIIGKMRNRWHTGSHTALCRGTSGSLALKVFVEK